MTIRGIDPSENEFLASLEAKARQPNPFLRVMANRAFTNRFNNGLEIFPEA